MRGLRLAIGATLLVAICFSVGPCNRHLGWQIERHVSPKPAVWMYTLGCKLMDARSCTHLGLSLRHGRGTGTDHAAANTLFERSCDMGDAYGCAYLGRSFEVGLKKRKDSSAAATLYQRACKLGYPRGCVYLGLLYARGDGVTLDRGQALKLFESACGELELGCALARSASSSVTSTTP